MVRILLGAALAAFVQQTAGFGLADLREACPKDCGNCFGINDEDVNSGNYPPENKHWKGNAGGWGGTCVCPDGQEYRVGDARNGCGSLACLGGTVKPYTDEETGEEAFCGKGLEEEFKKFQVVCKGAWNKASEDKWMAVGDAGGWGGKCTCPSGEEYYVGDHKSCGWGLACWGGTEQLKEDGNIKCDWELPEEGKGMSVQCAGSYGGWLGKKDNFEKWQQCVRDVKADGHRVCKAGEAEMTVLCAEPKCAEALKQAMEPENLEQIHKDVQKEQFDSKPYPPQNVHRKNGKGGWGGICKCPDGQEYRVGDNMDSCGSLACFGGVEVPNPEEGDHKGKICYDGGAGDFKQYEVVCAGYESQSLTTDVIKKDMLLPIQENCGHKADCPVEDTMAELLLEYCIDDVNRPLTEGHFDEDHEYVPSCCAAMGEHAKCVGGGFLYHELTEFKAQSAAKDWIPTYMRCRETDEYKCAKDGTNCPAPPSDEAEGDDSAAVAVAPVLALAAAAGALLQ